MGGRLPCDRKDTDVFPIIRQVVDELDDANPDWSLRLQVTGDGRGHWDPDRLSQLFSNLVGNAIQHGVTEHGVEVRVDGASSDRMRVEIHNGGTVPPAARETLFEPLAAADGARTHARGLGLGLFITHEIVRAHGGQITVDSDPAQGTTFVVDLPRRVSNGA